MRRPVVATFLAAALLVSLGGPVLIWLASEVALGDGDLLVISPTAADYFRRPPKSFSWDQVDPSKKATCGFNKCFFRHRNGKDGYLVGLARHEEDMTRGYERGMTDWATTTTGNIPRSGSECRGRCTSSASACTGRPTSPLGSTDTSP